MIDARFFFHKKTTLKNLFIEKRLINFIVIYCNDYVSSSIITSLNKKWVTNRFLNIRNKTTDFFFFNFEISDIRSAYDFSTIFFISLNDTKQQFFSFSRNVSFIDHTFFADDAVDQTTTISNENEFFDMNVNSIEIFENHQKNSNIEYNDETKFISHRASHEKFNDENDLKQSQDKTLFFVRIFNYKKLMLTILQTNFDYDILQNSQSMIIRNFFENLNDTNSDDSDEKKNEITEFASFARFISFSIFYAFFIFVQSSFSTFSFEMIQKQRKKNVLSFFLYFVLDLWFEKSDEFRSNYVRFREILQLTKFFADNVHETHNEHEKKNDVIKKLFANANVDYENVIQSFSLKLDIFKKQMRRHVLLLNLMRKALSMIIEKIFFFVVRKKKQRQRQKIIRTSWQYWYDSINLIRIILASSKLRSQMHFDMTEYVDDDERIEFWHFKIWNSSIRIVFDDVCYIQRNELIISDDIVRFKNENASMIEYTFYCDKMIFIKRNHRQNAMIFDEIRVILQFVTNNRHFWIDDYINAINDAKSNELFFFENLILKYSMRIIMR